MCFIEKKCFILIQFLKFIAYFENIFYVYGNNMNWK